MSTYGFQLIGVTDANIAAITAALNAIPGCTCSVVKSDKGSYLVYVETDLTEDEALALVSAAIARYGVAVRKMIATPPIVVGPGGGRKP